ncbi:MAG: hypothetical protein FWC34_07715 [Bacteroidetes bacterium]|nr:hypothetical protein [Bacteroidota bacterium]MCL2302521.1 hypothetical protein [Lentimicrobiaceae bacterium]
MKKNILILGLTVIAFIAIYVAMTNNRIYQNTLGRIIAPYERNNNWEQLHPMTTYQKFSSQDLIQWDVVHYYQISRHGYDIEAAGGDYIFAFFPLQSAIIKIFHLSPLAVSILSFILFSLSILMLCRLFSDPNKQQMNLLIYLTFPFLVVFLIPQNEALYMFLLTLAIYGFMKKNYGFFFIGVFLAALTRHSSVLLGAFLCTEFFFIVKERQFVNTLKNTALRILPIILGTLCVSLIQLYYKSGSIFKFMEVQKNWGQKFGMPHFLRDWSYEGFSINIGVICLIFIPLFVILSQLFFQQLLQKKNKPVFTSNNPQHYLYILSTICIIGNTLLVIFFRGGSLHDLFRYSLCNPFFIVLLFGTFKYIDRTPLSYKVFSFATLSLFAIFTLALTPFSTYWHFTDTGLLLMISAMGLWLFQEYYSQRWYKFVLYGTLLLNIVWTTFLFNTFLTGRTMFL